MADIKIQALTGLSVQRYIDQVARLRITVFREFPYLYDGTLEYEAKYLQTYIQSPDSVVVMAFDGDQVIGASTAVPMAHETEEFKRPFVEAGMEPDKVFYLGESILEKRYRGQGIGVQFFIEREAHARRLGGFTWSAFCAVDRPSDHPRRPPDYQPLDAFWQHRGYGKHPELHTTYTWKDLDEAAPSAKSMTYWLKRIEHG